MGAFDNVGLTSTFEEKDSDPFVGLVVADEIIPNQYNESGEQWHFAIRPLDYALQSEGGVFHERANDSTSPTSKLGLYIEGFKKAIPKSEHASIVPVGQGKLVGKIGLFIRGTRKFGGKGVRMTIPVGLATEEQKALAQNLAPLGKDPSWKDQGEGGVSAQPYQPPAAKEFDDLTLGDVLKKIEGLTRIQRMRVAAEEGGDVGAALADESIIQQMVDKGFAVLDGDVVRRS